jgi:hypothetical protein
LDFKAKVCDLDPIPFITHLLVVKDGASNRCLFVFLEPSPHLAGKHMVVGGEIGERRWPEFLRLKPEK